MGWIDGMGVDICFDGYLESVVANCHESLRLYTLMDDCGQSQPDFFELMMQVVHPQPENKKISEQEADKKDQNAEPPIPVLEIYKYAQDHVLLMGKAGSGKSTALQQLLLNKAQEAQRNSEALIPVLVKLRSWQSFPSVIALIQDVLETGIQRQLDEKTIIALLFAGRLLLLIDGINELPSYFQDRNPSNDVEVFRKRYRKTPMIFTTRVLGVSRNFGIAKQMEMLPLSDREMRQFIERCLPQQSEQMLNRLGDRLRRLGETPLLLSMLCDIARQSEDGLPANLGSPFREFAEIYDHKIQENIPVDDKYKRWVFDLLQHLAFAMMPQNDPHGLQREIPKFEAEKILVKLLYDESCDYAKQCLENLLKYHLIQVNTDQKIKFCHQLIQEYYAAEYLWRQLKDLTNEKLQKSYINYWDWTDSLALMLELVEDEEQAVRVVRLALDVDLLLGARLAGAVKYGFQEKMIKLIVDQHCLPTSTVSHLLGLTRSEKVIPYLKNHITRTEPSTSTQAIKALGKVLTRTAVDALLEILKEFEDDELICGEIALALGEIRTPSAVSFLEDWNIRKASEGDEPSYLKFRIEIALWKVHGDSRKPMMFQQIIPDYSEQDFEIKHGEINLDNVIKFMESEPVYYDNSENFIKNSLTKFKDEDVIPRLAKIVSTGRYNAKMLALEILCSRESKNTEDIFKETLGDEISFVREVAISGLAKIGSESIIPLLAKLLIFDKDRTVRDTAIRAFGKIGGDSSFKMLTELFKGNQDGSYSLGTIAKALGDIGREESIDLLISKIDKENESLSADIIEALGSIGGDRAIRTLIQLLNNEELDISDKVAKTLTDLVQTDRNLPTLTQQLPHLLTLIPTEASQTTLSVITAIQARCKYYNYDIAQTPLPPEDNPNPT
ncbi:MAG: HEAT repeat domain-containing protein, partial [Pseudanabaena sp. ELA607]